MPTLGPTGRLTKAPSSYRGCAGGHRYAGPKPYSANLNLSTKVLYFVQFGCPGALRIRCTGPAAGALLHVEHTLHCNGRAELAAADAGINRGALDCFQRCVLQDVVHSGRGADRIANENQVAQADSRVVGQLYGLCGHVFYGQLTGLQFQGLRVVQYEMNSVEAGEVASRLDSPYEANAT